MKVLYFATAIIFIAIAHLIRIMRWKLFIEIYEKPNDRELTKSLAIGYFINYVAPFKLGDVVRAWISGRKMKNGIALGFSTVIVERYLDIIAVGIIFIALSIGKVGGAYQDTAQFYVVLTVLFLGLILIVYICKGFVKRIVRGVASVFNRSIEAVILQFAWALIWNFKDIYTKINKLKLIITTVGMWILYLISYFFYAKFESLLGNEIDGVDIFALLFGQSNIMESTGNITIYSIHMILYMIVPLILLLCIAFYLRKIVFQNDGCDNEYLNLLPHLDSSEQLVFLENYFSDKNREYIKNYLQINQNISIVRDYSAGSNATTILCINDKTSFFRKYAFGQECEKLFKQLVWIKENKNRIVLPDIIQYEKKEFYCYYDMPYNNNAVGLFEYVHSMPIEKGWEIIQSVLNSFENSIYKVDVKKADSDTIHKYIEDKVKKNVEIIKNARRIKKLQQYKEIIINGIPYRNLSYYEKYLNEKYLQEVFKNDTYSIIHGDLTIENIICTRGINGKDSFYIIDPNTGNIHESPNLDYGKLLQSIHGGYEFLMATKEVEVIENRINFLFTKSSIYVELHRLLKEYMRDNFGNERSRSIYFHEIVHWLRLMPYKIEKDGKRALLFYAGMLMIMNDIIEEVENEARE